MTGDSAAATSDFHLVELRGAWRLTIRRSDRLLAALTRTAPGEDMRFTVQVEPTLLPSGPFEAAVEVIGDQATGS